MSHNNNILYLCLENVVDITDQVICKSTSDDSELRIDHHSISSRWIQQIADETQPVHQWVYIKEIHNTVSHN